MMRLKPWDQLPDWLRTPEVRKYYDILARRRRSLFCKRLFDLVMSLFLLVLLSPVFLILAFLISADSPGGIFFRQIRVTVCGRIFRIHKFRTMVENAEQIGAQVTVGEDRRITRIGHFLRKYRLDEIPQLLDILNGDMSFVGPRPEVPKYVEQYTNEMLATLLLPAGVTSEASIRYKDESRLLDTATDVDTIYVRKILPGKMRYNLRSLESFSFWGDIGTMFRTVLAVAGKDYGGESAYTSEATDAEVVHK